MHSADEVKEGNPAFKHGVFEEFCAPLDVSAALIECQGTYMLHLAFLLTIVCGVTRTSDIVYCFGQNAEKWTGPDGKDSWEQSEANKADPSSFLNQSLDELTVAHLLNFLLLLYSRLHYFKHPSTTTLSSQGVARLLTIPIYLVAVFRAEYAIRRYRAFFNVGATTEDFTLMLSENPAAEGGTFCFAEEEGNVL
jgi:hypothetical protein